MTGTAQYILVQSGKIRRAIPAAPGSARGRTTYRGWNLLWSRPDQAAAYKGKPVAVVGGANSAGQAAMFFSRFASQVYVLVRDEG